MPHNLLKVYPELLEIAHLSVSDRNLSLKRIFDRDIRENENFNFRNKKINPVKIEKDAMKTLFTHLTTRKIDYKTNKREFEYERSVRLHWVKHHIDENLPEKLKIFSVEDREGVRTYIFDEDEKYVVILEPYRNKTEYYLITAYNLKGRNTQKIKNKYKRRLGNVA